MPCSWCSTCMLLGTWWLFLCKAESWPTSSFLLNPSELSWIKLIYRSPFTKSGTDFYSNKHRRNKCSLALEWLLLLILLKILQYRKLYIISFPSHCISFFHLSFSPSLPAEVILVHLGMQSRHALTLWCIWQMHNRPPASISTVCLDRLPLIDALGRHVLLSDCKNDLPSIMDNSVGALFELLAVPPTGWCHLFTYEHWHPLSA